MARTIKIDFYTVEMPEGAPARFHEIIEQVAGSPDDGSRTVSIDKCPVRMQCAERAEGCWHGDMTRIRMNEGAILTKLSGETNPIDLDDDEGLGEQTAFLYHPAMNILVVQRNRFAVSASKLARYFERMGGLDEPIELDPIYTRDALQRLARLTTIRKLDIRVAGPINAGAFRQQVPHFGGMIDLIEAFRSPRIAVDLSMGRARGSLSVRNVVEGARAMVRALQRNEVDASKIEIRGSTKDEERDILDLVEERMTVSAEVEQADDRTLPYANRRAALRSALRQHRDELRAIFAG